MKFILILILSILVIRFLFRLLLPGMVKVVVKKATANMQEKAYAQETQDPEGTITIKPKNAGNNKNQYTDYEEVK